MFSIGRFYFYLLLVAVVSGQGKQTLRWGGELALKLNTPPPADSSILWKHKANKVVEYDRDFSDQGITAYGEFRGRATLDRPTGTLTVTSLTKADNGVYTVEYNSKLQPETFTISVLKAVPKPTIQIPPSCNPPSCNLTCEGSTTDAGDVSYSWKMGDGQMTVSQMTLQITSEDPSPITCKLANQLGVEVSDPVQNPLHQSSVSVGIIMGILAAVIVVIGVGIAFWKVPSLRKHVSNLFQQLSGATHNVTGANAGQDGATTDTNNRNASDDVAVQPSSEKVPLNKVKTLDPHDKSEDRQDNGIPTIPPESEPLIDQPHKDDSNNTSKTVPEAKPCELGDPETAGDATAKIDGSTSVVSMTPGNDATTGTEPAVDVAIEGSTSASPGTGGPGGGGSEKGVNPDPIISPNVPQNLSDRMESSQSYALPVTGNISPNPEDTGVPADEMTEPPKEDPPANDAETGPLKKSDDEDKGDAESKKL